MNRFNIKEKYAIIGNKIVLDNSIINIISNDKFKGSLNYSILNQHLGPDGLKAKFKVEVRASNYIVITKVGSEFQTVITVSGSLDQSCIYLIDPNSESLIEMEDDVYEIKAISKESNKYGNSRSIAVKSSKFAILKGMKHDLSSSNSMSIFSYMDHPDCCGTQIAFGFGSDVFRLNDHDKTVSTVKTILHDFNVPFIAHLARHQKLSKDFLMNDLDGKLIHTYKNRNSGNEIDIIQFNNR